MSYPYGGPGGAPTPQQPGGPSAGYPAGQVPPSGPQPVPGYPQGPPSGPQPMPPGGMPPGQPGQPGQPQGAPGMPPAGPGMPQGAGAPLGGPVAPPPPPGMGRIVLHTKYYALAFMLALFKPRITINGQPGPPGSWGQNVIDLPPGQHHVQIHVPYIWTFGRAAAPIPVSVGQQVDVFYAAPAMTFGDGAIAPTPQEPPLKGLALGLFVGAIGFAVLMIILSIVLVATA